MPIFWDLLFDYKGKHNAVRVGNIIGRQIGVMLSGDEDYGILSVVQTGRQAYSVVPASVCVPLEPAELVAEAQAILAAAIEQVRFLGFSAETVQALFGTALLKREGQPEEPATPPDEKASSEVEAKMALYRLIITGLINRLKLKFVPACESLYSIHDASRNRFVLMCVGWGDDGQRTCYPVFFIELINGLIKVNFDSTEGEQVFKVLLENGISEKDIFLIYRGASPEE